MLLSKTTKNKWNPKNKKYYEKKGYVYTAMGEKFEILVEDLTKGSNAVVEVKCDYCGKIFNIPYVNFLKGRKSGLKRDSCGNVDCLEKKQQEVVFYKYGVENIRKLKCVEEKRLTTIREKYGVDNVFQNQQIKEKIKQTFIQKYGVSCASKSSIVQEKIKTTCLNKYGVPCYLNLDYSGEKNMGENNPRWKGGSRVGKRPELDSHEYYMWRKNIFEKYHFTCQRCKQIGGNLEAHHIFNYADYKDLRLNEENGIVLCKECHKEFHKKYGKKNNTLLQLKEFLS